jgi:hypothetical protein
MRARRRSVRHNLCTPDGYSDIEWRALRQRAVRTIKRLPATYLDPKDARIAIDCIHADRCVGSPAAVSFLCGYFLLHLFFMLPF